MMEELIGIVRAAGAGSYVRIVFPAPTVTVRQCAVRVYFVRLTIEVTSDYVPMKYIPRSQISIIQYLVSEATSGCAVLWQD